MKSGTRLATESLTPDELTQLRELVEAHGVKKASEMLQIHRHTLLKLLPPPPLKRQTAHWIRSRLELFA